VHAVRELEKFHFRHIFTSPGWGETVRAFLIFGILLLVLIGVIAQLAFKELGFSVISEQLELVRGEARSIARTVSRIGNDGGSIDFSQIRNNEAALRSFIEERFARRFFLHHVEIRDRFGVRQLFFSREPRASDRHPPLGGSVLPSDWPWPGEQIVRVPLGRAEGEVRVGLSSEPVIEELEQMQNALRIKVAVASALALGVFVVGFFYVFHLVRKNRLLEQARQSAARASYVGLLASGLAHEIRNPLNAMNMNLQMLEEELQGLPLDDADFAELLESTNSEIKRLERLVNNFLAYALLGVDFKQSEVELRADLEPLLPTVEIDETQFKQALINLLVNARQVLDAGGRVTVRTRAGSGGEAIVEIEDNGPGIAAEMQDRVFEVFYSSRGGGTGLGLPIAKQIVERHGGTIELQSAEGEGTTFRISLRRRHRPPAQTATTGVPAG